MTLLSSFSRAMNASGTSTPGPPFSSLGRVLQKFNTDWNCCKRKITTKWYVTGTGKKLSSSLSKCDLLWQVTCYNDGFTWYNNMNSKHLWHAFVMTSTKQCQYCIHIYTLTFHVFSSQFIIFLYSYLSNFTIFCKYHQYLQASHTFHLDKKLWHLFWYL